MGPSLRQKNVQDDSRILQSLRFARRQSGTYNGFLAAGLTWGLVAGDASIKIFLLVCVVIAGIYGGFTAKRSIPYLQALPGLLALVAVCPARLRISNMEDLHLDSLRFEVAVIPKMPVTIL